MRKDDSVGIRVIDTLLRKVKSPNPNSCIIHPPSIRFESPVSRIDYSKEKALLLDAADFNAAPGSAIFASLEQARFGFFATHNIPLKVIPLVSDHLDSIFVYGIQPMNIEIGEGLTKPVQEAMEQTVELFLSLMEN